MSPRRTDFNDELVSLAPNPRPANQERREYPYRARDAQETIGHYRARLLRAESQEGLTREAFTLHMQETIGRFQHQIQERERRDLLQRLLQEYRIEERERPDLLERLRQEYQRLDVTDSLEQEAVHLPLATGGPRLSVDPPATLNSATSTIKIPDECHLRSDTELENGVAGSCVICLHNIAICVALPCGHLSYCVECSRRMCTSNHGPKAVGEVTCAHCRDEIQELKRVYMS